MESWQRTWIIKSKDKLVKETKCTESLLNSLESSGILDRAALETIEDPNDQSQVLYDILQTHKNGFWLLVTALANDAQKNAFKILLEGVAAQLLVLFEYPSEETYAEKHEQLVTFLQENASAVDYLKLGKLNKSALVKNTFPFQPPFYVPRKLAKRAKVNEEIFTADCPDIFVFKNIEFQQLAKKIGAQHVATSSSQIVDGITSRFICLDDGEDWKEISSSAHSTPAHLISFDDFMNAYILEETTGISQVMHRHLDAGLISEDAGNVLIMSEERLVKNLYSENKSNQICICDFPGVGKTALLTSLARKTAELNPDRVVAFFSMSELLAAVKMESPECEFNPIKVVIESLSTSKVTEPIVAELFAAGLIKLEIFLDGVDEVAPQQTQLALSFLQKLASQSNARVHITFSNRLPGYDLAGIWKGFTYEIVPLSTFKKVSILVNLWEGMQTNASMQRLLAFGVQCLENFEAVGKDQPKIQIQTTPLQCRLLAEVFAVQAAKYSLSASNAFELFDFAKLLHAFYGRFTKYCFSKCRSLVRDPSDQRKIISYHLWKALEMKSSAVAEKYATEFGVNTAALDENVFLPGMLTWCKPVDGAETIAEFYDPTIADFLLVEFFAPLEKRRQLKWTDGFQNEIDGFLFNNPFVSKSFVQITEIKEMDEEVATHLEDEEIVTPEVEYSRLVPSNTDMLNLPHLSSLVDATKVNNPQLTSAACSLPQSITFSADDKLGKGSGDTYVYRGNFGFPARPAAVKVVSSFKDKDVALEEIRKLITCDSHSNIVRYLDCCERPDNSILIALELCHGTLEKLVKNDDFQNQVLEQVAAGVDPVDICRQITCGVAHLHMKRIIHRDLKPSNVLIKLEDSRLKVKISDFGISRVLDDDSSSQTFTSAGGSDGWMAPETLQFINENQQESASSSSSNVIHMNRETDIFSLGCIFYYVLTEGKHIFGDNLYLRNDNILTGHPKADANHPSIHVRCNVQLMLDMVSGKPDLRPSSLHILGHPMFWPCKKKLQFLVDVSNFVEGILWDPDKQPNLSALNDEKLAKKMECIGLLEEGYSKDIVEGREDGWFSFTEDPVYSFLKADRFTKHRYRSVISLVRVIRNFNNHYEKGNLTEEIKQVFGSMPTGFINYWISIFPLLVHHVRQAFSGLKQEDCLSEYYKNY